MNALRHPKSFFAGLDFRSGTPFIARKQHMEGRVKLRFIVRPDGRVRSVKVVGKSRYLVLDRAAVKAVMASAPFPEPPKELFAGPVPLEVSIVFELM